MSFDSFNKVAGATLGAILVFLLLGFFSGQIFGTRYAHEPETLAFALELEEETEVAEAEEPEAEVDLAALVADADPSAGESIWRQCQACHNVEDTVNAVGPHLVGVVGRDIATVEGYAYSDALAGKEGAWDLVALSGFLENPSDWAPGTLMGYAGLKDAEDRVNLIAWLNEQGPNPVDLAAMAPEETAGASSEATGAEGAEGAADASGEATEETPEEATNGSGEAAEGEATETAEGEAAEESGDAGSEGDGSEMAAADPAADAETGGEAASGGQYAQYVAASDPAAGQKIFRQCQACHAIQDGANRVGPHLWNLVGREIAAVEGFRYSDALSSKEGVWNLEKLMAWLEAPMEWAPGTTMGYAGLEDPQDRVNVIAYINQESGQTVELE